MSWMVGNMTKDDFSCRFTQAVVKTAFREKRLPFGRNPSDYAADVLQSYWREYVLHGGTPERYAREDAMLWD